MFDLKIFDYEYLLDDTGAMSSGQDRWAGVGAGADAGAGAGDKAASAGFDCMSDPAPASWQWPDDAAKFGADAPLQALMLSAAKLLGAYGQCTADASGLKISLAGLGVLRVLMGVDGLKASEVAARAWSSPGTLTAVVNTLVRDGLVERRPDPGDRRVVRLHITDEGRAAITSYVSQAAPQMRKAFDFVDEQDEAVVRKFFVQMIGHLGQLMREERGR
jgi:DNA-binding MarR family transcriptional regulator